MDHAIAVPELDLDPFSMAFFDDPYPGHAAVREAAPVVWLPAINAYGVGRHAEIDHMLKDWQSFTSARGVGIRDYHTHPPLRGPSMILEMDPPVHTRRRAVLNQALSPSIVRGLRAPFTQAAETLADRLAAQGDIDGIADIAEAYPLAVFPDAPGMEQGGRENLLPFGNFVFNSMGPDNALLQASLAELPPLAEWATRQSQRDRLRPGSIGMLIHEASDRG